MEENNQYGPLRGMRVIDLGTTIAGPMAASLLGDFGADVIKVEHPKNGDPLRSWAPFKDGMSLIWKVAARNKRLVTLNLKHYRGQEIVKQLISSADVLIENFRPGTLEKWGLGFEELTKINSRIIVLRISGYGQDGPFSKRPGYGTIAEAMTGIPAFTGDPEGPPTLSAFPLADAVTGIFGAFGVLLAIYERDRNPDHLGQVIDLSLYESLFRLAESQVIGYDQAGIIKKRLGNRMEGVAPRNAYQTIDGEWITISASSDQTFLRLLKAIGKPGLADDSRFKTNDCRINNENILDKIIREWINNKNFNEAMNILEHHDVIAGPILTIREIFSHPQYIARKDIIEVLDKHFGQVRMQGIFPRLMRTPGRVRHTGQDLGEHNRDIYVDELGLSLDDLSKLKAEGVI